MRTRAPRMVTVILLLTGIGVCSAGCYERVVRVEGLGTNTIDIYEPNSADQPDALDGIIWGERTRGGASTADPR